MENQELITKVNELIDQPCQPNPQEWAITVEDIFKEKKFKHDDAENSISNIKTFDKPSEKDVNIIVTRLKQLAETLK